ncbi:hypothetical protein PF002_g10241 [Phytophthora fragariae]|uniref:RxLR effector protein n=1 Tax=Phytophthora fragariae TaxID=53985 RepID=A0A6A3SAL8_9STRA|nr:hypothetical protein PF003_g7624 [Phytophthora fragariae]KAE9010787.1 hypothetical protein PF011_g9670 [Phytophthora fragariae]KAE9113174.1 hypothetical protein PF007_g10819 [Phytophthora fragariae]KAE9148397.1 hypothetical protein PF006_g6994 [Phytophthora fragariae]KAE9224587.1 hypothetical protein PF004_g12169 [Phytophthora fragariae]
MSSSLNCSHAAIVLLIQINLFSAAGSSPVLSSSAHSDFISCFSDPSRRRPAAGTPRLNPVGGE